MCITCLCVLGGCSTRVSLVHGQMTIKYLLTFLNPFHRIQCSCGSVVEHCVSSTKGCGFNSQETHILIIHVEPECTVIHALDKCINVNSAKMRAEHV